MNLWETDEFKGVEIIRLPGFEDYDLYKDAVEHKEFPDSEFCGRRCTYPKYTKKKLVSFVTYFMDDGSEVLFRYKFNFKTGIGKYKKILEITGTFEIEAG